MRSIGLLLLVLLVGCEADDRLPTLVGTLERDRLELIAEAQEFCP